REKEKWRVVTYWRDVIGVVPAEPIWIVALNKLRKSVVFAPRRRIQNLHRRIIRDVLPHRFFFFWSEGALLCQHSDVDSIFVKFGLGNHDEVIGSISNPQLMQSIHRHRHHSQSLPRFFELPSRYSNHAIELQMLKIFPKGLRGA